jgi:hypothetical protein
MADSPYFGGIVRPAEVFTCFQVQRSGHCHLKIAKCGQVLLEYTNYAIQTSLLDDVI